MTDDKTIKLSRRKVLSSLGLFGGASALGGAGTMALFSDTESFPNSTLAAGTMDLKIDWQQTYHGPKQSEVYAPAGRPYVSAFPDTDGNGIQDMILTRWQLFREYPDKEWEEIDELFRNQFADLPEDMPRPLIDFSDVKPGDWGEVTFSVHLFDNPGYIWMCGDLIDTGENGETEPERHVDTESGGELLDEIQAVVWYDDGDNQYEDEETIWFPHTQARITLSREEARITRGTLREVLDELHGYIPLDWDPRTDEQDCFQNSTTRFFGFKWWLPMEVGNVVQTDSVTFDLGFYAEQCRHNELGISSPGA